MVTFKVKESVESVKHICGLSTILKKTKFLTSGVQTRETAREQLQACKPQDV